MSICGSSRENTLSDMVVDNSIRRTGGGGEKIQSLGFVISVCICVVLCCFFVLSVVGAGRAGRIELENRINPNDAPAASMVRLSGIGPARAAAVVAYRQSLDGQGRAFRDCGDLQKVTGIGPKTAESMCGWLKFE